MFRLFLVNTGVRLNGSTIIRGDTHKIGMFIVGSGQQGAILKFVAKSVITEPPLIEKTIQPSVITDNFLKAYFTLLPDDTSFFSQEISFMYDLERTLNGDIKTLEQGNFYLKLDIAI